jgi:hypothetical protein
MTPSAEKHLQRFPSARASKLRQLEKQDEVTARLRAEIDARKRPISRLMGNVRALRRLIGLGV